MDIFATHLYTARRPIGPRSANPSPNAHGTSVLARNQTAIGSVCSYLQQKQCGLVGHETRPAPERPRFEPRWQTQRPVVTWFVRHTSVAVTRTRWFRNPVRSNRKVYQHCLGTMQTHVCACRSCCVALAKRRRQHNHAANGTKPRVNSVRLCGGSLSMGLMTWYDTKT